MAIYETRFLVTQAFGRRTAPALADPAMSDQALSPEVNLDVKRPVVSTSARPAWGSQIPSAGSSSPRVVKLLRSRSAQAHQCEDLVPGKPRPRERDEV